MNEYKCPFFEVVWKEVDGLPKIDAFCEKFRYEDVYKSCDDNPEVSHSDLKRYRKKYDLSCRLVVDGDLMHCARRGVGDSFLGRISELNPEPIEKAEMALKDEYIRLMGRQGGQ